jgi:hypothetical protein
MVAHTFSFVKPCGISTGRKRKRKRKSIRDLARMWITLGCLLQSLRPSFRSSDASNRLDESSGHESNSGIVALMRRECVPSRGNQMTTVSGRNHRSIRRGTDFLMRLRFDSFQCKRSISAADQMQRPRCERFLRPVDGGIEQRNRRFYAKRIKSVLPV